MVEQETDIKTQILNDFLGQRRQALYMKSRGDYWYGLDEFRTLLSCMPLSEENNVKADEIIKEIDKIEEESYKITDGFHEANRSLGHLRLMHRNNGARMKFNILLRRITKVLQEEGYFDIILGNRGYGPDIRDVDFTKADEM